MWFPALAKPGLRPQKSDRPDLAIYLCVSFLFLLMAKNAPTRVQTLALQLTPGGYRGKFLLSVNLMLLFFLKASEMSAESTKE